MKTRLFALFMIYFVSTSSFCQSVQRGCVSDGTGQPISLATVYINGTTNGTKTDAGGCFELQGLTFPCQLVVSHLGYFTKWIMINEPSKKPLSISIKEKTIQLSEVSVIGKSQRTKLVRQFKEAFLGSDNWGNAAKLLNDSVLVFHLAYNPDTVPDGDYSRRLTVSAAVPLIIDLPLLGYKLRIDLDTFALTDLKATVHKKDSARNIFVPRKSMCYYAGFYYFKPYEEISPSHLKKIERNRLNAFYNSREHFSWALYHAKLKKNGFLLIKQTYDSISNKLSLTDVSLDSCFRYDGKGHLLVTGLKDQTFQIHYFCDLAGKPVDLTKKDPENVLSYFDVFSRFYKPEYRSYLTFTNNSCTIDKDGLIPDNSIAFGGKAGEKKVGSTLPNDYRPGI
ncbi:MAG: carboxypeptidase-like regulatory domain-containing protein [Bacteroidota bacterium]|nr:carboxypeptidase-like regulatory domain-containing protein [Bacteroidota bacterium]